MFASSQLPAVKPDRRAYIEACRLHVDPAHALMVGDNYELDVLAARAAGPSAIHLDRFADRPEPTGDRISTLHDLLTRYQPVRWRLGRIRSDRWPFGSVSRRTPTSSATTTPALSH